VIATVADDLDDVLDQQPKIGLVATSRLDLGLVGGDWYVDVDRDTHHFVANSSRAIKDAGKLMGSKGFGTDRVPDLLAVSVEARQLDVKTAIRTLADQARTVSDGKAVVVGVGLPVVEPEETTVAAHEIIRHLETETAAGVVEEAAPGGLFLDQHVLVEEGITKDQVVTALRALKAGGRQIFADAFPGIAVSFARFC
jgi:hypothetical protein